MNINKTWIDLLENVIANGSVCTPRGTNTLEILGHQSKIDMSRPPAVYVPGRGLSYKFMVGEAWWILSGGNRVSEISPYLPRITQYSDDGVMFNGAYGPPVVSQLSYVVDSLGRDIDSRQAVLTIWNRNPRPSKDIPCTLAMQWLIRDNRLHCVTTMRSSDSWVGWVYDVFNFTMISTWVLIELRRRRYKNLQLGNLILTCGSQHIYESNLSDARDMVEKYKKNAPPQRELFPLLSEDFRSGEAFVSTLKLVADAL